MGKFSDRLMKAVKSYSDTEWTGKLYEDDDEITLAARPLTPADMAQIARNHPDFGRNPSLEGMVDLIILKAKDPLDGLRAFDKGDKPILMKLETDKVGEIFAALFGKQLVEDDDEKFEARVGNSKKTAGE